MTDLSAVFKAYDVRGVVPDQLNADLVRKIGAAAVQVLGVVDGDNAPGAMVVGYDMRPSSPDLAAAFAEGVTSQGADVIDIGLASTDQLYFASGHLGLPGAMFTASHNPAQYNGVKLCRVGAAPVGSDTGLDEIRVSVEAGRSRSGGGAPDRWRSKTCSSAYADYLKTLVDLSHIRPLTVVVDAGNGMAATPCPQSSSGLPLTVDPDVLRARRHVPQPRGQPARAARTSSTCRPRCVRPVRTSAWPSTAMPTAASSSTSAARSCRRRRSPR